MFIVTWAGVKEQNRCAICQTKEDAKQAVKDIKEQGVPDEEIRIFETKKEIR